MSSTHLLRASRERLFDVSAQLASYLADSEQVFLLAGDRLSALQQRAQALVAASSASADVAAQDDESVERLAAGLADLKRCLAESGSVLTESASGLARVLSGIDELARFRGDFQRAGVTLWSLAISMRVENSRSGEEGSGFETVVTDVRRLGTQIEVTFDTMMTQAVALRTTAAVALTRARAFLDRDASKLVAQAEATTATVSQMRDMRVKAAGIRAGAAQASAQVAAEVMGILTVLQMHDIARQMMEHVCEELDGLDGEADLADVAALATLQAAQLANARETLAGGLEDVALHLHRISGAAVGLSRETEKMAELGDGTSIFTRIDSGIEESSTSLREQLSRERFATGAMCRASAEMRHLAGFASEIERIGAEVKLIALNAQVQAEKNGERGRSMSVLARAVRELSVDVDRETTEISGIMARICEEASHLRSKQARGASNASTLDGVVADMSARLAELRRQYAGLVDGIAATAAEGGGLRDEVESLAGQIEKHAREAQALRDLEAELERVSAEATAVCGAAPVAAAAARLRAAASRYTMEQERAIHRAAIPTSGAISAPEQRPTPGAASGGLGDNVELF